MLAMSLVRNCFAVGAVLATCAGPGIARAQHTYDIIVQQASGRLVTAGCCNGSGQWTLGKRVFSGEFPIEWATNNPGYGAFGTGSPNSPVGSQAPPASTALNWDFLPMTIDGLSQNLFYWNGLRSDGLPGTTPDDVDFGPLPGPSYTLSEFDKSNTKFSVDGTDTIVTGGDIGETHADGSLHFHRYFFLEDNDGDGATSPADGVYLIAERYRMDGVLSSDPVLIVFGTPNSTVQAIDNAAIPWIEQQLSLPGDYNADGVVDAADYTVWRNNLGLEIALTNEDDTPNVVDAADYDVWKQHFGEAADLRFAYGAGGGSMAAVGISGVPEPSSGCLFLLGCTLASRVMGRRRRIIRTSFSYC
jgi:hypothetical protein